MTEVITNNEPNVVEVKDQPVPVTGERVVSQPVSLDPPVIIERETPVVLDEPFAPQVEPRVLDPRDPQDPMRAAMLAANNTPAAVAPVAYVEKGPGKYRLEYFNDGETYVETFDTVPLCVNRVAELKRAGISAVPYTAE